MQRREPLKGANTRHCWRYSITLSAVASSDDRMVRPSVLAVLRLKTIKSRDVYIKRVELPKSVALFVSTSQAMA
jgi:hypothetical protein